MKLQILPALTLFSALLVATLFVSAGCAKTAPSTRYNHDIQARYDASVAEAKAAMLVDTKTAIIKAQAAKQLALKLDRNRQLIALATAEWLQGEAYLRLDHISRAAPLIKRALGAVLTFDKSSRLAADLFLSEGGIQTAKGNAAAALDNYQRAHNIFHKLGDARGRAIAMVNIAALYRGAKDQNAALKYFSQALDIYHDDQNLLLSIHNNRGDSLNEIGKYQAAEREFNKALTITRQMGSSLLQALVLGNIARGQLLAGRTRAADITIALGRKLSGEWKTGGAGGKFEALAAQSALQKNDLAKARRLIVNSFKVIDPASTTISHREAHQTAFDIFNRLGEDRQALIHLQALKRLDDKAIRLASLANTALAAARFDFTNQELRIAKLKADELQRNIDFERARARTEQLAFVGVVLVALLIVAMLLYNLVTIGRSRNRVRAANVDLAETNTALAKALAAKTEFLATTSHEIRTPLNGILGMTQVMLAERAIGVALRERIGVIHSAGLSMRALVDDILDVAKIETGNLTIEQAPMDLKAMLLDVSRMWEEQARGRALGFALDLEDCPEWIEGDAARLRQIVYNLLSNALKFTEAGSVGLHVSVNPDATPAMVLIAISDSGIGIPEDKREPIFESFRQGDAGTTRRFGGTGLGLTICRNLARAMGGDVHLDPAQGQGSVFTLKLPFVPAAAPLALSRARGGKRGLVIVDRNPITRSMLRAVLEARAGTITFAGSPGEAIEHLDAGSADRVLIDDMTIKACDEPLVVLAEIARAADVAGARAHLLWNGPLQEERDAFAKAGITHVIAKPITGTALVDVLYPRVRAPMRRAELVTRAA